MAHVDYMKKCCGLCPFSRSSTLFLHPERAEEFAYMAENPYTDFPCHKTADYQEENEWDEGGFVHGEGSKTCHGFKTLQMAMNATEREYWQSGFAPDGNGFEDTYEMIDHHTDFAERHR